MSEATIITMLAGAVSVLFTGLIFELRQSRDKAWALYDQERKEHSETRKAYAADARENTQAIRDLTQAVKTCVPESRA